MLLVKPVRYKPIMAPKRPSGTANSTANGTVQLSYIAARNKNTNRIARPKITGA